MIILTCDYCGKSFRRSAWKTRKSGKTAVNNFCSRGCRIEWTRNGNVPTLESSPSWKGGRYVTQEGYVRVHKPDHPKATTNGWVFEHVVIACEKIGRMMIKGECVHHIDGNKKNNSPDNLQVTTTSQHTRIHNPSTTSRKEGEPNIAIKCACGCDGVLLKYDDRGRPRKVIHGHNARKAL